MNEQFLESKHNGTKNTSNIQESSIYHILVETEEKELAIASDLSNSPQVKRILLNAMDLKLNLTVCMTLIKSLDLNQPEDLITNQLLDLYYQDFGETPQEMATPNQILRSFSQKFTNSNISDQKPLPPVARAESFHKENKQVVIEIQPNYQEICPICFEALNKNIKLSCGHVFCESCLHNYLKARIMSSQINVFKCPDEKCVSILSEAFIQEFLSSIDFALWQKYEKFKQKAAIANDPNKKWCTRPGCERVVNKDALIENYGKCDCGKELCFLCGNAWHPNEGCAEAMDEVFKEYLKGKDSKPCPKCHQTIEKSVGCNVMACPYCRYTFCWICLREYTIGHFSIFNLNGCPGMDATEIRGNLSRGRRYWECVKGIIGFLLKMLMYFVGGILIYPFLLFLCIYLFLNEHRKSGGSLKCEGENKKKICFFVCLGSCVGILAYITYPIGFLFMFCYLCLCNPHVAYPYAEGRPAAPARGLRRENV